MGMENIFGKNKPTSTETVLGKFFRDTSGEVNVSAGEDVGDKARILARAAVIGAAASMPVNPAHADISDHKIAGQSVRVNVQIKNVDAVSAARKHQVPVETGHIDSANSSERQYEKQDFFKKHQGIDETFNVIRKSKGIEILDQESEIVAKANVLPLEEVEAGSTRVVHARSYTAEEEKQFEDEQQILCVAQNMYYEARGESEKGQRAVGIVTLLRTLAREYPKSACGVVYEGMGKRSPQFSWLLDTENIDNLPENKLFKRLTKIAKELYAVRRNPKDLIAIADTLGLTANTYFYKRHDWGDEKMSEANRWFWEHCVEVVKDENGKPLRIGDHVFFKPTEIICKPYKKSTSG